MRKIALYNLEPRIENTAMMQVSRYHKDQGHKVELYAPILHDSYDKIYAFSLFSFTPKPYVTPDMVVGGTGFDPLIKLPPEIARCDLDYSVFPGCKTSYIWFSRGCIRSCPFCVVPRMEGDIYPVEPKNLNPNGEFIGIMDNNFFANREWKKAYRWLKDVGQPVRFMQGIDTRILNTTMLSALACLPLQKRLHVAWDNPRDSSALHGIVKLLDVFSPWRITCYILVGYWSSRQEDMARIMKLRDLGVDPYVMCYNKQDKYQTRLARWVNQKVFFKKYTWEEFQARFKKPLEKEVIA